MFISKQISVNVYCIREIDQYNNDHVLMYLIKGSANQCILIDTGFGCNDDLLVYIRSNQLAADHQSIIVINTHNHAEQTGGNWRFSSSNSKYGLSHKICDLCASSADVIYTKMIDWRVKPYKITRWIDHGEEIQIDNDNRIVIYHTPGHTPDSLTIWYPNDSRLFIGDLFYQRSPICITFERSDIVSLEQSIRFLLRTIIAQHNTSVRLCCAKEDDNIASYPLLGQYHRLVLSMLAGNNHIFGHCDLDGNTLICTRDKNIRLLISQKIVEKIRKAQIIPNC